MKRARYKLLTGSAFAVNEDGASCRCHGADGLLEFLHGRTGADDVIQRVPSRGIPAQGKILRAQNKFLEGAIDRQFDLVNQPGTFANVIGGAAGFDRFNRGFIVVYGGNEDDGRIGRYAVGMAKHLDAINIRHLNVGDDDVVKGAVNLVFRRLTGLRGFDAVTIAAQCDVKHFADGALVVADQDISHEPSRVRQRTPVPRADRFAAGAQRRCPGLGRTFSPSPSAAVSEREQFHDLASIVPTPCLHAPAQSGTQWRGPARYRPRSSIGMARRSFLSAAGSYRFRYRQS